MKSMGSWMLLSIVAMTTAVPPPRRCPVACTFLYAPVCASDGKTYINECAIEQRNCGRFIQIAKIYDGKCVTDPGWCPVVCTQEYLPVCGTDGITYPNECVMNWATCGSPVKVIKRHQGPCW